MKKLGITLILILMVATVGLSGCDERPSVTKEFPVYITDAPFGKYWVNIEGEFHGFIGFSGYMDSTLRETYTIKFFYNGELKTLLIPSTDIRLHVIMTNDNASMRIKIQLTDMAAFPKSQYEIESLMIYCMNRNPDPTTNYICLGVHDGYAQGGLYDFTLYIPKPEICKTSDKVIE